MVGYFSPEAFANALSGMTQLQTLSLHFLSFPPRRNYLSLPPQPGVTALFSLLSHASNIEELASTWIEGGPFGSSSILLMHPA